MPASDIPAHATGWQDGPTRRALGRYAARALGLLIAGLALAYAGSLVITEDGNARAGVPFAVPFVLILLALMLSVLGVASLLNVARMAWVLRREPWVPVRARFQEVEMGTPNGLPVLHLSSRQHAWTLTLTATRWRWKRFATAADLLLAARPGHGGVVAPTDRSSIAWARRSIFSALLLRYRRRSR